MVLDADQLSGVMRTPLITLYARAEESQTPGSLLRDDIAADAVSKLNLDFTPLKLPRDGIVAIAVRAHILDRWSQEFLTRHPDAVVVHLGCGLDTRYFRLAPDRGVRWYNIDLPEVMAVRAALYDTPVMSTSIAASVTAESWLRSIPNDAPTLIVAEGLFPYLREDEVRTLLDRIVGHFPQGELLFDAYHPWGTWLLNRHPSIRSTGARLKWSLRDERVVEHWNPRLRLISESSRCPDDQLARLSFWARASQRTPFVRRLGRLLRYEFGPKGEPHPR